MAIIIERIYAPAPPSGITSLDTLRVSTLFGACRDTKSGTQGATAISRYTLKRDRDKGHVRPLVRPHDLSAGGNADDQHRLHSGQRVDRRNGNRVFRARRHN